MIAIELTGAISADGTTEVFYLANGELTTVAADTPAHQYFIPRLLDPGSIGRAAFADGRTGGSSRLETGEITAGNIDGALDPLLPHSFDAREAVIYTGTAGDDYPSAWTQLLTATMEGIEGDRAKLIWRLRDKAWVFDRPACPTTYAGTNSLPNGLEGTADDLKGQRKPRVLGVCPNVTPPCVNTARLIYEVGVCNSVDAVRDQGAGLTAGADYTSQSDMETNAPAAGSFRAWPAGGYFRLGSSPAGQVTADVTQGATAAARTTAQLLDQLASASGLSAGERSSADVTALDTANSAVVGIWLTDQSYTQAMDDVAASIGAYYGFDASGVLRLGRLTAPGTPTLTINDWQVTGDIERRPPVDLGRPAWKVGLRHAKNWTVQTSGLAGSVTDARRAWLAQETRIAEASDTAIKDQWLLATEPVFAGLLVYAADAATEAARLLALHKVRRDIFDVPVSAALGAGVALMDTVRVIHPRFGLAAGWNGRVIGIHLNLATSQTILTLWG